MGSVVRQSLGLLLLLWVAGLGACATTEKAAPSPQSAQLQKICRDTMGFPEGDVRFQNCVEALTHSPSAQTHVSAVPPAPNSNDLKLQRAREACAQLGLAADSPRMGDCVARMQAAVSNANTN